MQTASARLPGHALGAGALGQDSQPDVWAAGTLWRTDWQ